MLFASDSLAARIERAECSLLTSCSAALTRRRPEADVQVRRLAGGVAALGLPGSPLNKLAGLGFHGPLAAEDEAILAEVEGLFAARGVPLQAEVASLADPSVVELLTRRGYLLRNFENVLGRPLPLADLAPPIPGIEVVLDEERDFDRWLDIVVTGFANPDVQGVASHESFPRDVLEQAIRDMTAGEGFLRHLARHDGAAAGAASMRLADGVAQMCGAATLPAHRRRGVQTALLETRLACASEAGCDVAVVVTQPGSRSCENVQRQGFELLYTRAVLVRDPDVPSAR